METFEVHITGDQSIMDNGAILGINTIAVNLLRPDFSIIRTEYMTSHIMKSNNFQECFQEVELLAAGLAALGTTIIRKKIECPPYQHYFASSLYMESHFKTKTNEFPISQNTKKDYYLATDRVYASIGYLEFMQKYEGFADIELCLEDSNVHEDFDWLSIWAVKLSDGSFNMANI